MRNIVTKSTKHCAGRTDDGSLAVKQTPRIQPGEQSTISLPLVRIARLQIDAVSDDDLVTLYSRAIMAGAGAATSILAREAVRRPSLASRISPSDAYRRLVSVERDAERALSLIDEARAHAKSTGEATAPWDLAELELHITSGISLPGFCLRNQAKSSTSQAQCPSGALASSLGPMVWRSPRLGGDQG